MKYWLGILALILLASCGGGDGEWGAKTDLSLNDEVITLHFVDNLWYLAGNCLAVEPEGDMVIECGRKSLDLVEICEVAEMGGGDIGQIFESNEKYPISDHLAPFCERLGVILEEPIRIGVPHLLELAQEVEDSID